MFPVKDALMYIQSQPLGGRGKSFQGERFTRLTIRRSAQRLLSILKTRSRRRKAKRQESEREANRKARRWLGPPVLNCVLKKRKKRPRSSLRSRMHPTTSCGG